MEVMALWEPQERTQMLGVSKEWLLEPKLSPGSCQRQEQAEGSSGLRIVDSCTARHLLGSDIPSFCDFGQVTWSLRDPWLNGVASSSHFCDSGPFLTNSSRDGAGSAPNFSCIARDGTSGAATGGSCSTWVVFGTQPQC